MRARGPGTWLVLAMACLGADLTGCSGSGSAAVAVDASKSSAATSLEAQAYVWGYPLVVTHRTFQTVGGLVGANQLLSSSTLAGPSGIIVAPNDDTLYSIAVLDLRSEPQVLTVPDVTDRYWVYQFLDAWTNSFHYVGTRATAGMGGTFAITGPGWSGTLPAGVQAIASPTPLAFLLGRYLVRSPADATNVVAIQRTLQPLHAVTGAAAPPPPPPSLGAPPGTPQQVGSSGASFFDELGDALAIDAPASPDDEAALASFASIGIGAGLHPAANAMQGGDSAALAALTSGVSTGNAQIQADVSSSGTLIDGWHAYLDIGTYTNDFLLRSAIANFLWGANVPAEAVYAIARGDASGQPLTGARDYVLHFPAGGLPPIGAQGFWSVTMYGPDMFFVTNSIGRYAIGDRTQGLVAGADGSLDLYIQNADPQGQETNWLPAPTGAFVLILRAFLPTPPVLSGTYAYPSVTAM